MMGTPKMRQRQTKDPRSPSSEFAVTSKNCPLERRMKQNKRKHSVVSHADAANAKQTESENNR
jgi:hypothetical protein